MEDKKYMDSMFDLARRAQNFAHNLPDPSGSKLKFDEAKLNAPTALVTLYLFFKAERLFYSTIHLLEHSQIHASAYLVRGLVETRADLNWIIRQNNKETSLKFMEIYKLVLRARINLGFNAKFPKINKYWTDTKITERIEMLQPNKPILWFYNYLCAFTHSSSVRMFDAGNQKESDRCIREQLFGATESMLNILNLMTKKIFINERSEYLKIMLNFCDLGNYGDEEMKRSAEQSRQEIEKMIKKKEKKK